MVTWGRKILFCWLFRLYPGAWGEHLTTQLHGQLHERGGEALNFLFYFLRVLTKKQRVGNRTKRFYGEMWGNAVWRRGRALVKIPWDFPCIMVLWKLLITCGCIFGVCYMLNWIVGFCHKAAEIHVLGRTRLAPSEHRTRASAVGARCHNHHATGCCCITNLIVYFTLLPQPRADPGHIALPSRCTRHFSLPHYGLGFSWINLHDINHGK